MDENDLDENENDLKQTIDIGDTLTILISFVIGLAGWLLFLYGIFYAVVSLWFRNAAMADGFYWPMVAGGLLICAARTARTVARIHEQSRHNFDFLDMSFEAIGLLLQENNVAMQKNVIQGEIGKLVKKPAKTKRRR